jgi:hypothetical protein
MQAKRGKNTHLAVFLNGAHHTLPGGYFLMQKVPVWRYGCLFALLTKQSYLCAFDSAVITNSITSNQAEIS